MKNLISSYFYGILLLVACASCTDEWFEKQNAASAVDDSKLVEAQLSLGVTEMRTTLQTRSGIEDTPAERMINDIWVFQYDSNGDLLITPRYYDIDAMDPETDGGQVDVLLRKDDKITLKGNFKGTFIGGDTIYQTINDDINSEIVITLSDKKVQFAHFKEMRYYDKLKMSYVKGSK